MKIKWFFGYLALVSCVVVIGYNVWTYNANPFVKVVVSAVILIVAVVFGFLIKKESDLANVLAIIIGLLVVGLAGGDLLSKATGKPVAQVSFPSGDSYPIPEEASEYQEWVDKKFGGNMTNPLEGALPTILMVTAVVLTVLLSTIPFAQNWHQEFVIAVISAVIGGMLYLVPFFPRTKETVEIYSLGWGYEMGWWIVTATINTIVTVFYTILRETTQLRKRGFLKIPPWVFVVISMVSSFGQMLGSLTSVFSVAWGAPSIANFAAHSSLNIIQATIAWNSGQLCSFATIVAISGILASIVKWITSKFH